MTWFSTFRGLLALTLSLAGVALARPGVAQNMPAIPVVVTRVVEREVPPSIRLVGTVRPERTAVVASELEGAVLEFDAQEGQFLKKGEVICRLDPAVPELRRDEAKALCESARQKLAVLEAGERPEEIRRLQAQVEELRAILDRWTWERRRIADLHESGQGSEKEYHDTEMEFLAGQRRLAQADAQLDMARNGARKEEIARAKADCNSQLAVLSRLERDVSKCVIVAPFDGFITTKRAEVGEWLILGGPVCEMIALETVKVRIDVPDTAIAFVRAGASATLECEGLRKSFTAAVTRVIPQAATAARTFPVEIDLPNTSHELLAGMFIWANVPAGVPGKRLLVSKDAIVAHGTAKQIFVIRPGENGATMAIPTPVTTGLEVGGSVEVQAAGLAAGDQVVIRANERLMAPTPVQLMPEATAAPEEPASRPSAALAPGGH